METWTKLHKCLGNGHHAGASLKKTNATWSRAQHCYFPKKYEWPTWTFKHFNTARKLRVFAKPPVIPLIQTGTVFLYGLAGLLRFETKPHVHWQPNTATVFVCIRIFGINGHRKEAVTKWESITSWVTNCPGVKPLLVLLMIRKNFTDPKHDHANIWIRYTGFLELCKDLRRESEPALWTVSLTSRFGRTNGQWSASVGYCAIATNKDIQHRTKKVSIYK